MDDAYGNVDGLTTPIPAYYPLGCAALSSWHMAKGMAYILYAYHRSTLSCSCSHAGTEGLTGSEGLTESVHRLGEIEDPVCDFLWQPESSAGIGCLVFSQAVQC